MRSLLPVVVFYNFLIINSDIIWYDKDIKL